MEPPQPTTKTSTPPPIHDQEPSPKKLKMSSTTTTSDDETTAGAAATPRLKRRKIAIFFAYCGVGYQGMQRNPGAKTIESDLERALFLAGAVPEPDLKRHDFARSARTDKGVSAVGQVVSGRFCAGGDLVARLNESLPDQIRVFGYRRATASFSAKRFCDRRRYVYLIPVFALDPTCHRDRESVRESAGSGGGELVKCLPCSERGRKVHGVMGKRSFENSVKIVDSMNRDGVVVSGNDGSVLNYGKNGNGDGVEVSGWKGCSGNDGSGLNSGENVNGDCIVEFGVKEVVVSDSKDCSENDESVLDSVKVAASMNGDGVVVSDSKGCSGNDESVLSSVKNVNGDGIVELEVKEVLVSDSKDCPENGDSVLTSGKIVTVDGKVDTEVKEVVVSDSEITKQPGVAREIGDSQNSAVTRGSILNVGSVLRSETLDSSMAEVEVKEVVVSSSESMKQPEVGREIVGSISNVGNDLNPESLGSSVAGAEVKEQSRFSYGSEERERFNRILKSYVGSHNFHNFTTRTKAEDPAAMRHIISFDASTTVTVDGIEFVKCEVVGQSFMLHQIRKMIGLAVAIMRNCAPESLIETALQKDVHINVPTAPEVGLYLDECMFSSYNEKWKDTHEELSMKDYAEEAEEFKMKHIYTHIAATEHKEGVVGLWLHSLNLRNYADLGYKTSSGANPNPKNEVVGEKIAENGKVEAVEKND